MNVFRYETDKQVIELLHGPVIFLAGPTVRGNQQHLTSWRFECVDKLERQGFDGSVIIPEFVSKTESDKGRYDLPIWENVGLTKAHCILFWVPRTRELIGLTTNWEIGYWMGRDPEKVVYGRPDDAYRIDYLDIMWNSTQRHVKKICKTLNETVKTSIEVANWVYEYK